MISPPLIVLDLGKIQTEIQKIEIVGNWLPQTWLQTRFFTAFPSPSRDFHPACEVPSQPTPPKLHQ